MAINLPAILPALPIGQSFTLPDIPTSEALALAREIEDMNSRATDRVYELTFADGRKSIPEEQLYGRPSCTCTIRILSPNYALRTIFSEPANVDLTKPVPLSPIQETEDLIQRIREKLRSAGITYETDEEEE